MFNKESIIKASITTFAWVVCVGIPLWMVYYIINVVDTLSVEPRYPIVGSIILGSIFLFFVYRSIIAAVQVTKGLYKPIDND